MSVRQCAHTVCLWAQLERAHMVGFAEQLRLVHLKMTMFDCRADGIVEHVVLLGAPVTVRAATLRMARCMTAGRFVNGYSVVDWVLSLSFRCARNDSLHWHSFGSVCTPDW